jgi:hypothetical protein
MLSNEEITSGVLRKEKRIKTCVILGPILLCLQPQRTACGLVPVEF